MSDAVKNGPRMKQARSAKIAAEIELCRDEAAAAKHIAGEHRRKGQGKGARAWYHHGAASRWDAEAAKLTKRAHDLRVDLAKAKADEAARNVKHVKRTVASTAAEGLVPKAPGQPGPAKPTQAKGGGQRQTCRWWSHDHGRCPRAPIPGSECCEKHHQQRYGKPDPRDRRPHPAGSSLHGFATPQPKGSTMTVSGEAVNIEQTRANLDQLKGQVSDLRGSFEGISGSLASGGLNNLAGSLASADDSLDSVLTQIGAAEKHLSDQEAIAEAAQAAGEMHTDTAFYG